MELTDGRGVDVVLEMVGPWWERQWWLRLALRIVMTDFFSPAMAVSKGWAPGGEHQSLP